MAISTNGLQLARIAGAVFNQQLSASDYSEILAANKTAAELDAWANAAVAAEFRGKTTTDIAKAVLANVGLSSITGLEAWVAGQLTAGGGVAKAGQTMLALLNDYSNMSTTDATYGASVMTFNQKSANSQALSQTAGTATGTFAAVSTAAAAVVFPLTTGADVKTFGSGNDTINALFATATGMTFQATDSLDGGTGSDTINIQVGVTGTHAAASMIGIETVSANFSAAGTVSLLNSTGVTTIESSAGTAAAAFSNIGSVATALRVSNNAQDATFGFTTAAVAGTADTVALTLSGVTGGTVTLAGVETVGITSSGSANTLTGLTATSATTVNVSGDQALALGTLGATVTTLNAGSNTAVGVGVSATMGAATTATITGGTGNDSINISAILGDVSIAGGAGNDTVTATTNWTTTDTITGGDGTADVLSTTAALAEAYSAPSTATISGFEQLTLSTIGTAAITLTTSKIDTGIARVNLAGTTGVYGITGPAGALTVTSTAALGGTLTLTDTGTAITDAATLTNSGVSNVNVFGGAAVTSTGYETLNINSGSGSTTNAAAQTLGAVTVTVDTGGASAVNFTGANSLTTGAVSAVTISASGMTGAAALTMASATGATSITGTANADSIGASSVAASVTGGAGNDTITGGTLNDTINGGDGADSITGGVGKDSMTGGAGADVYTFAANATGSVVSNLAVMDTITDFVTGTDKLSITNQTSGAPSKFLGNFTSLTSANASAVTDGTAGLAFFVTGDNTLYVQAVAGTQATLDTAIYLPAVTSLAATDLLLGAQGTGSTITLTAAAANLTTAANTNASAVTTTLDDSISTTAAFLVNSTVTGGSGSDTLTISTAPTTAVLTTLAAAGATGAVVSEVEAISFTLGTTNSITMPNTANLAVTNASSSAASTIAMGTGAGQSFTATGSGTNTIAINGATASISGGTGTDAFTVATGVSVLGSTFLGGTGSSDSLVLTDASLTLAFNATAASSVATRMTGIETLTLGGAVNTLTITNDQAITINGGTGVTTVTGTAGTGTITVVGAAATAVNVAGTSNFAVSGQTSGAVTKTGTGTLAVTATANDLTVTSDSATTITATALGGEAASTGVLTLAGANANTSYTVNGLGTAALGALGDVGVVTEAGALRGNVTVTTAGTVANTITQTAGNTGTFTTNVGGTGAVTYTATASHSAQNISLTNTGALTVQAGSTATAYTITTTSATAHTYVNSSSTLSVDTYTGSSTVDNVTLGLGADLLTTGGGADVITLAPTTDTGLALGNTAAAAISTTAVYNTSGMDKITGFSAGATIVTATSAAGGSTAILRNGATWGADIAGDLALIVGTYSASTNQFTTTTAGTDTLVIYDDNGVTAAGAYRAVVLVGYVDLAGNDTLSAVGTLTSVAG